MDDSFVSLPPFEGAKSLEALKHGDFKENYLLFISCFQLGKHKKIIKKRIIENFEKKVYLNESFMMLNEISGFKNKNIFSLDCLFDMFSKINFPKYEKEIFNIFYLQLYAAKFNKTRKYSTAYKLYNHFTANTLDFCKEDFEELEIEKESLLYIFYKSLVYFYIKETSGRLFRIEDDLISVLDKEKLLELKDVFSFGVKIFDDLIQNKES